MCQMVVNVKKQSKPTKRDIWSEAVREDLIDQNTFSKIWGGKGVSQVDGRMCFNKKGQQVPRFLMGAHSVYWRTV